MAAATAAVAVAAVVTAAVVAGSGPRPPATLSAQPATSTAKVQRGPLSATVSLAGSLTYAASADGSPYTVINQASGTYTELPTIGQVVTPGHVLYRVDGHPVVLLHGATAAYRTLAPGSSGADVAQLNADLVALGYATRTQLDPASPTFTAATAAAVIKLQAATGLTRTGTLPLGAAVFQPTALRVIALTAEPGTPARAGQTVLEATSTTRQVQVPLDASQQTEVATGDKVSIVLPDNRSTPGVVTSVGTVATCPQAIPSGGSTSTSPPPGTDSCGSTTSSGATPTIAVTVTPTHPDATGTWDQAPVRVAVTTARVPNALAVPVTALLARAGGGYAVEVIEAGGAHHLLPVSLGLFDDAAGLVQVNGAHLAAGQKVVVPAL